MPAAKKKPAPKTPDEKKLVALLKRAYGQKQRLKGLQKAAAESQKALNVLKGKIAATRGRINASKRKPADKAVRWALSQQGVGEKPDGSNWGIPVQTWIKNTGYSSPVPWCGCFVHEAVVEKAKAKIPSGIRLGYNGYIVEDAENNTNGLKAVPIGSARAGDIVTFDFPHIALVRGPVRNGMVPTIEGNTSPTSSGSQNNGGTVAAKLRPVSQVRVVARPKYPK